jgi:Spx/MgsR family transcriptional regulator
MTQPTLYGLDNCDSCKKARKWLQQAGVEHRFVDYRKTPIPGDVLKGWAARLGWDALINRSGTTWRGLLPNRKNPGTDAEYVLLVRENPSLVRRPVVVIGDAVHVGFTHGLFEKLFGTAQAPS